MQWVQPGFPDHSLPRFTYAAVGAGVTIAVKLDRPAQAQVYASSIVTITRGFLE